MGRENEYVRTTVSYLAVRQKIEKTQHRDTENTKYTTQSPSIDKHSDRNDYVKPAACGLKHNGSELAMQEEEHILKNEMIYLYFK